MTQKPTLFARDITAEARRALQIGSAWLGMTQKDFLTAAIELYASHRQIPLVILASPLASPANQQPMAQELTSTESLDPLEDSSL